MTGKCRGCAHTKCNLDYGYKKFKIPVLFHNLKGYDSHFIIEQANKFNNVRTPRVIAQISDKLMMFQFDRLEFKDSFGFLSSPFDKLVK